MCFVFDYFMCLLNVFFFFTQELRNQLILNGLKHLLPRDTQKCEQIKLTKSQLCKVVAIAADLIVDRHGTKVAPLVRENWAMIIKSIFPELMVENLKAKLTTRIRNMHRPKKAKRAKKVGEISENDIPNVEVDSNANMNDSSDIESFLPKHIVQGNKTQ